MQLNWVDVFVVILLIRIVYISVKTGFFTELFKLLGTICAICLAYHQYIKISNFSERFLPFFGASGINLLGFFTFLILAFLGYSIFLIIRKVLMLLIKMEPVSLLNRWGAITLGLIRGALFCSMVLFVASISNINCLTNSLSRSFSAPGLIKLAPNVYLSLWNSVLFRFMNKQAPNEEPSE